MAMYALYLFTHLAFSGSTIFSRKPNIERTFVNVNTLTREPSFVQELFKVMVADFFYAITITIEY